MFVSDYLHRGAEQPKTAAELCELLHIDKRALTAAIERERRAGSPICASCDGTKPGYFLAETRDEMEKYCSSLHHRAAEIYKTRKACLQSLEALPEAEKEAGADAQ
jgi:hypothetical protein